MNLDINQLRRPGKRALLRLVLAVAFGIALPAWRRRYAMCKLPCHCIFNNKNVISSNQRSSVSLQLEISC